MRRAPCASSLSDGSPGRGAPNPGPRLLHGRIHGSMEGLVSVGPLPTRPCPFFSPTRTSPHPPTTQTQKPANTASDTYRPRDPDTPTYARECPCPSSLAQVRRRPAVRRKPLNPGAGQEARGMPGGPLAVTEGYRRSPPLPPTLGTKTGGPPVH